MINGWLAQMPWKSTLRNAGWEELFSLNDFEPNLNIRNQQSSWVIRVGQDNDEWHQPKRLKAALNVKSRNRIWDFHGNMTIECVQKWQVFLKSLHHSPAGGCHYLHRNGLIKGQGKEQEVHKRTFFAQGIELMNDTLVRWADHYFHKCS